MFLTSPNIKLDWAPGAWLYNKLLDRQPDRRAGQRSSACRSSSRAPRRARSFPASTSTSASCGSTGSTSARQVSGRPRSGSVRGQGRRSFGPGAGRASALINDGGDRIAFHLDAEPDRNKFDLARAASIAPANGLVPAMIGTKRAMNLTIGGKGSWTRWRGRPRSTFRAGRRRGWRSASTAAATACRANGRRRNSSPASFSG